MPVISLSEGHFIPMKYRSALIADNFETAGRILMLCSLVQYFAAVGFSVTDKSVSKDSEAMELLFPK